MTQPATSPHGGHDLSLLAAAADRDADEAIRHAAASQAADCRDCAALLEDFRAIASGFAGLPMELEAPRDMRLTPEQAASLRRGGWVRTLLRPFGSAGWASLKPVAGALTTLGLAGILFATAMPQAASMSLSPVGNDLGAPTVQAPGAAGGAASEGAEFYSVKSLDSASPATAVSGPEATRDGSTGVGRTNGGPTDAGVPDTTPPGPSPVLVFSVVVLLLGLGLVGMRIAATRTRAGS